jgi:glycyl-tRNA synthetase beta chain
VAAFSAMPEAAALAAANKRVSNLLLKQVGDAHGAGVCEALLQDEAERELASALARSVGAAAPLLERSDYTGALRVLAELRAPVDTFFDKVLVMVDDAALRANRLALLAQLRAAFMEVADISALATTT